MKTEKQRIAIAEACGWTHISQGMISAGRGRVHPLLHPFDWAGTPPHEKELALDDQHFIRLPDYLNDLNAMHEAEATAFGFDSEKMLPYLNELDRIGPWIDDLPISAHATAAQRAEAFIRTLNLWIDHENPNR